jgi:hypothetical protein
MADYTAAYCYIVTMYGTEFRISRVCSTNVVCSDGEDDNVFSAGDGITIDGGQFSYDGPVIFMGVAADGWLGLFERTYYFFTPKQHNLDFVSWAPGDFAVCFLAGTAIATPGGAVAIEALSVGDLVSTADGEAKPVRFVGRQTIATPFASVLRTRPIRIAVGALGEGLPARDLCVSPDHALMLDGVLVQAGALVNGTTITRMTDLPERFTYFHVELDDHSLILAEGVPAETFVDNVTRRRFDNWPEYEALYGEAAATIAELDVPRVKSARQLPRAVRDRIAARTAALLPAVTSAA